MQADALHRFLFEGSSIRGELVQLEDCWQTLHGRQDYPPAILSLLGEAAAAGVLLAATIKFDGSLTLQLNSEGRLRFLVVECTGEHSLRGLARWRGDTHSLDGAGLLNAGQLVMTIDQGGDSDRYQSIIELGGERIADCLDHYFERSEQLPTRLWLAADGRRAAGLLVQEMPATAVVADTDLWDRVTTLAATVHAEELLRLAPEQLLRRLFHEETVRVFKPQPWSFHCPCTPERVDAMLRGLGRGELESILDEHQQIAVDCEFCGQPYRYDAVDVEQLLSDNPPMEYDSQTRH